MIAAGCGGGDEFDAGAVDQNASATPPVADGTGVVAGNQGTGDPAVDGGDVSGIGAEGGEETPGINEIASANAAPGTAVKLSAITPKKFAKAHCSKPIMVVYYQPKSVVDTKMLAEAKLAASKVKDTVLLVYTPKDVKASGDLPAKLGLFSTPGVATVNRSGAIENFWVSYVDHALLEFSLRNAANAKPCKVDAEDVPAPGSALADAALVASGGTVAGTTTSSEDGTPPNTPAIDAAGAVDPVTGQPATPAG